MTIARTSLHRDDARYPARLRQSGSFEQIECIGNLEILGLPSIGLFCSRQCPGTLVNATYDLAQRLRDAGQTVIGGFHSPMEQECLRLLLRGAQLVVVCPARGIQDYRVPGEWRAGLEAGRLLLLSPFGADDRRVTAELAERRNHFVAELASEVFIAYAAPDSATLRFADALARSGKPILTHSDARNASLLALGARLLADSDLPARTDLGQMPLFDR